MSDSTAAASASPAVNTPKKKAKSSAAKKPKTAPSHPKVSEMVISAITSLKERGGSSLQAIKKHVASNHKVDIERLSPFIKKYLKSAVASGTLVQTKGKGATGSFKLSGQKSKESPSTKTKAKKVTSKKIGSPVAKKASKSGEKKKTALKKAVGEKKKTPAKKAPAKKISKVKTPKKAVKATKPKSPKPKKVKTPKKPAGKKTGKK